MIENDGMEALKELMSISNIMDLKHPNIINLCGTIERSLQALTTPKINDSEVEEKETLKYFNSALNEYDDLVDTGKIKKNDFIYKMVLENSRLKGQLKSVKKKLGKEVAKNLQENEKLRKKLIWALGDCMLLNEQLLQPSVIDEFVYARELKKLKSIGVVPR